MYRYLVREHVPVQLRVVVPLVPVFSMVKMKIFDFNVSENIVQSLTHFILQDC